MSRYFLFMKEEHENIHFDFSPKTIDRVIELWHKDYTNSYMCQELKISHIELALIVMDLDCLGKLEKRRNGLLGSVEGKRVS